MCNHPQSTDGGLRLPHGPPWRTTVSKSFSQERSYFFGSVLQQAAVVTEISLAGSLNRQNLWSVAHFESLLDFGDERGHIADRLYDVVSASFGQAFSRAVHFAFDFFVR